VLRYSECEYLLCQKDKNVRTKKMFEENHHDNDIEAMTIILALLQNREVNNTCIYNNRSML